MSRDLLYIKKQTFWLDVKLIVLSLCISSLGKCEYRGKNCAGKEPKVQDNR